MLTNHCSRSPDRESQSRINRSASILGTAVYHSGNKVLTVLLWTEGLSCHMVRHPSSPWACHTTAWQLFHLLMVNAGLQQQPGYIPPLRLQRPPQHRGGLGVFCLQHQEPMHWDISSTASWVSHSSGGVVVDAVHANPASSGLPPAWPCSTSTSQSCITVAGMR